MSRIVRTGLIPRLPRELGDDALLVTLSRSVSADGIISRRLNDLAIEVLRKDKLSVASTVRSRHILKRTIAREFPDCNAAEMARRIGGVLRIVLRTGIEPQKLVELGSARVQQLGKIASAYRDELRRQRLVDREEILWAAAACKPERRRMTVFGYHRARKEEVHFIDAVAADGSTYYLPCGDAGFFTVNREWAAYLADQGWTILADDAEVDSAGDEMALKFAGLDIGRTRVEAVAHATIESEVRAALSAAKVLVIDGADPYGIAIAVRDQKTYAPVIAAISDEYGLPILINHTVPLGSTAFGGFIRILSDVVGNGLPFESTLRLTMHALGPKLEPAKLAEARRLRVSGLERWKELLPDLGTLAWPDSQPLAGWIVSLRTTLDALRVQLNAAGRSGELIAYNTFIDSLFAAESLEEGRSITFESFAAIAGEILTDESSPLRPANAGVLLAEPKDIIGSEYQNLFVLGMSEGVFPRPPSEDPVVDFYERRHLAENGVNFAQAAEVARWEDLSFYFMLLGARGRIVMSYPQISAGGESMPSSYFSRLRIKPIQAPAEPLAAASVEELRRALLRGDGKVNDDVLKHARFQYSVERRRESSGPYDEFDGITHVPIAPGNRKWSASQLTVIGQCSFHWYAQRLLRLKPAEEMETGLDPSTRGKLYHKALEIAVERAKDAIDIRAATLENLDAAFAEAEKDPDVGLPNISNWATERAEQLSDLKKAVAASEFIAEGSRVVGIEQEFTSTWHGFPVTGMIDRVDNTPNGLIAIDYKTSSAVPKGAKDDSGKLSVDVQIPLYANVALRELYPGGTFGNSAYYSLTKGKILRTEKEGDLERLEELGERITNILADGAFAVDPDDAWLACTYCEFDAVCRKGPRLRRKSRA